MTDRQVQRAGAHSQQIQVHGDYYQGLSATQLREVVDQARTVAAETARFVVGQLSEEARAVGARRVEQFDQAAISELSRSGLLAAFQDPGFQIFLRKAQMHAAATERESDHDILVRLLADRAERGETRRIRAALDRAVEVIDLLDDEALTGLTVFSALQDWGPAGAYLGQGFDFYDELLADLMVHPLPDGAEWIDHLELLDCLRVSQVGTLKRMEEFLPGLVQGYVARGVEAGSEMESRLLNKLLDLGVNLEMIPHELKPGYSRLGCARKRQFEAMFPPGTDPDLIAAVREVVHEFDLFAPDAELAPALLAAAAERPHLARIVEWWDAIPSGIILTSVGRVVARANAKRCDVRGVLPPIR